MVRVAVEAMAFQADGRELRIGDGDAAGVLAAIKFRSDTEAGPTVCRPNQAHDGGEVDERRPTSVHRGVRKQPVLDLVPLARLSESERGSDKGSSVHSVARQAANAG
jgi:hypothetical protein